MGERKKWRMGSWLKHCWCQRGISMMKWPTSSEGWIMMASGLKGIGYVHVPYLLSTPSILCGRCGIVLVGRWPWRVRCRTSGLFFLHVFVWGCTVVMWYGLAKPRGLLMFENIVLKSKTGHWFNRIVEKSENLSSGVCYVEHRDTDLMYTGNKK